MSTTPVVNLELQISPRILEKIRNSPNGILWGWGETDSWKKPEAKKSRDTVPLKGQCHEIFCFWFFSWISFPLAPEYSIKTVSNFSENSRSYSQLKLCHRCQRHRWRMEKIFNQKNFNNFVWSPLGSRGNIYINFCLQVHFQVSAAWYCSHYLPPVLCRWFRFAQLAKGKKSRP